MELTPKAGLARRRGGLGGGVERYPAPMSDLVVGFKMHQR